MTDEGLIDFSFPLPASAVFEKILWTDWYDGFTSGLVVTSDELQTFRADIVAWGPNQWRRVFMLRPFNPYEFNQVVSLLAEGSPPTWPRWMPPWAKGTPKKEDLRAQIEQRLKANDAPQYVIESDADFESIYAIKAVNESITQMLPHGEEPLPPRGNYDYWNEYLGRR